MYIVALLNREWRKAGQENKHQVLSFRPSLKNYIKPTQSNLPNNIPTGKPACQVTCIEERFFRPRKKALPTDEHGLSKPRERLVIWCDWKARDKLGSYLSAQCYTFSQVAAWTSARKALSEVIQTRQLILDVCNMCFKRTPQW